MKVVGCVCSHRLRGCEESVDTERRVLVDFQLRTEKATATFPITRMNRSIDPSTIETTLTDNDTITDPEQFRSHDDESRQAVIHLLHFQTPSFIHVYTMKK